MIVVVHPTGNRNVRAILTGLFRAGLLSEFATTLAFHRSSVWLRYLPAGSRGELLRRAYDIPVEFVHTRPWREVVRLAAGRGRLSGLARHETGWASMDAVYRDLDEHAARRLPRLNNVRGVYAYEDGACHVFEAAGQMGLMRFYDLPIGYWRVARRLLEEEATLQPEWAATLTGNRDSPEKLARKDEELHRADAVFVASSFTARTLAEAGMGAKPVHVVPYGAPTSPSAEAGTRRAKGAKLQVLFVGALGQRKGLSYLLSAMKAVDGAAELTLIGRPAGEPCGAVREATAKNRHIPSLPHEEILAEMRRHDVLVLPSLFEGFGLVLLEAMSQGLPVITTPHTAGPDIIAEGQEGFIVPIRSSDAIADRLAWLAGHREDVRTMGEAARAKAATYSWVDYGAKTAAVIEQHLLPRRAHEAIVGSS